MKSNRFYLACLRDTVGSNVTFHCHDRRGYSANVAAAHVYSLEEAQHAWERGREFDLPLCADQVDALSIWHVDSQKLPHNSVLVDGCTRYVAFQTNRWDGNDVFWLREGGLPTTNFLQAAIYDKPGDSDALVWLPYDEANAAKQRRFCVASINRRKMIQAAGLLTPAHIKRHRRRKDSGKTRWNCERCGQFSWQYNPYEFDGCKNINCDL